jgi:thiol-disulfide isomerase/thioredoxin
MNHIKTLILVLVVATFCYLSFSSYKKVQQKKEIERSIQRLPAFSFQRPNQEAAFTNANLDPQKKTLLIYFNPTCDHCQYMTKQIKENKAKFGNHQLLFVTLADHKAITEFQTSYGLQDEPNIVFLRDTKFEFENVFGAGILPSFFLYDEKGTLVKKILGEVKIEKLLY